VRDSDVVGRYGGEEFVIVLPGLGQSDSLEMAERLRAGIASSPLRLPDGQEIGITVSLGVATYPDDGRTLEAILVVADAAMYQAKQQGKTASVPSRVLPTPTRPDDVVGDVVL
jgi:diguanylate cyclase (GGDEF)-like protein